MTEGARRGPRRARAAARAPRHRQGSSPAASPTTASTRDRARQIHALLGENGAGKSHAGQDHLWRAQRRRRRDKLARPAGRDLQPHAAPHGSASAWCSSISRCSSALDRCENIALGIDRSRQAARPQAAHHRGLGQLRGCRSTLDPPRPRPVGRRAPAHRDRPLPAPGPKAADHGRADLRPDAAGGRALFATLRRIAREGCAILYISHKLEEIRALCGHATIMRLGRVVAECDPRVETGSAGSPSSCWAASSSATNPHPQCGERRTAPGGAGACRSPRTALRHRPQGHSRCRSPPARSSASAASPATARTS